jgi:hypothetical protein
MKKFSYLFIFFYAFFNQLLAQSPSLPWKNVKGLPCVVFDVATTATTIYAGTECGLFESNDAGLTWITSVGTPSKVPVQYVKATPKAVLAAFRYDTNQNVVNQSFLGVFTRSSNESSFKKRGESIFFDKWTCSFVNVYVGAKNKVFDLYSPNDSTFILSYQSCAATINSDIYRSVDGGSTWHLQLSSGLPPNPAIDNVVDDFYKNELDNRIYWRSYYSLDNGLTWNFLSFEPNSAYGDTLIGGLQYSFNHGQILFDIPLPNGINSSEPMRRGNIGKNVFIINDYACFFSRNLGQTWEINFFGYQGIQFRGLQKVGNSYWFKSNNGAKFTKNGKKWHSQNLPFIKRILNCAAPTPDEANLTMGNLLYWKGALWGAGKNGVWKTDSCLTQNFSINEIEVFMCEGQTLTINNQDYNYEGTYEQYLTNYVGCDSLLRIKIGYFSEVVIDVFQEVALGDILFGVTILNDTTFAVNTNHASICDTIFRVHASILTVNTHDFHNQKIKINPNPFTNQLILTNPNELTLIYFQVFDTRGTLVFEIKSTEKEIIIPTTVWPIGVYFVKTKESGLIFLRKVVKI